MQGEATKAQAQTVDDLIDVVTTAIQNGYDAAEVWEQPHLPNIYRALTGESLQPASGGARLPVDFVDTLARPRIGGGGPSTGHRTVVRKGSLHRAHATLRELLRGTKRLMFA